MGANLAAEATPTHKVITQSIATFTRAYAKLSLAAWANVQCSNYIVHRGARDPFPMAWDPFPMREKKATGGPLKDPFPKVKGPLFHSERTPFP